VVRTRWTSAEGGYLSNVCLACMPVFEERRTIFMIGVCLDTTITISKCSRYVSGRSTTPVQAVAFGRTVKSLARNGTSCTMDYRRGQSTRDRYVEQIKKGGGRGDDGIPLGTADMTDVHLEDHRELRRPVRDHVRRNRGTSPTRYDLG